MIIQIIGGFALALAVFHVAATLVPPNYANRELWRTAALFLIVAAICFK